MRLVPWKETRELILNLWTDLTLLLKNLRCMGREDRRGKILRTLLCWDYRLWETIRGIFLNFVLLNRCTKLLGVRALFAPRATFRPRTLLGDGILLPRSFLAKTTARLFAWSEETWRRTPRCLVVSLGLFTLLFRVILPLGTKRRRCIF